MESAMNSILIIQPYRYAGTWVFDDPNAQLVQEPFVEGIPCRGHCQPFLSQWPLQGMADGRRSAARRLAN